MNVGVVIGRFQVGQLHEGHVALLSTVAGKCSRLVVLVGESPAQLNAHDPLPFFCRADAIKALFPQAHEQRLNLDGKVTVRQKLFEIREAV